MTRSTALRATLRASAVILTLAGTMLTATAAWAGDDTTDATGPDQDASTGQQATQQPRDSANEHLTTRNLNVTVSPRRGRPSTKVWVEADGRQCDSTKPIEGRFLDRTNWRTGRVGHPLTVEHASATGWYGASYTISDKDAVGLGRFVVQCTTADGQHLVGSASFRVRPASSGTVNQPSGGSGTATSSDSGSVQVPSRIDTGLGGTATGADRGPNLTWLTLAAGALLLGLATWLLRATETGSDRHDAACCGAWRRTAPSGCPSPRVAAPRSRVRRPQPARRLRHLRQALVKRVQAGEKRPIRLAAPSATSAPSSRSKLSPTSLLQIPTTPTRPPVGQPVQQDRPDGIQPDLQRDRPSHPAAGT